MSDKKIYGDNPYEVNDSTKVFLGGKVKNDETDFFTGSKLPDIYPTYKEKMKNMKKDFDKNVKFPNSKEFLNKAILDDNCSGKVCHFRKPRQPLDEHPLNTIYKEDAMDLLSKGLMLGGVTIISKGVSDALGAKYAPLVQGATIVGAGALIYKLTEQDIKKYYRNYISRLEGNYDNLISYNDYRQFVKKYNFKYEEDYYMLNDILAGKEDPVEFNKFLEMNRYNSVNRNIAI